MDREKDWTQIDNDAYLVYKGMKRSVNRIGICVIMVIVGILMFVFSKGDKWFILLGIAFLVIAALFFRIARKEYLSYKKQSEERIPAEERITETQTLTGDIIPAKNTETETPGGEKIPADNIEAETPAEE